MDAFARRVGFSPTPAAGLADPTRADQADQPTTRSDRLDRARPGFRFDWSKLLPPADAVPAPLRRRPGHGATGAWSAGRARGRSPTRSSTNTCARCTATSSNRSSTSPTRHPPTATSSPTDSAKPSGCWTPADVFPFACAPPAGPRHRPHHALRPARAASPARRSTGPPASATTAPWAAPPPHQDPRHLDPAPTLRRHLPLARPPRPDLPRRPHRHPQDHRLRRDQRRPQHPRPRHHRPPHRHVIEVEFGGGASAARSPCTASRRRPAWRGPTRSAGR